MNFILGVTILTILSCVPSEAISKECRDFFTYYDEVPACGCEESQEVTDKKEKVLRQCAIKNASDTTAAEECCFWTHLSSDLKLVEDLNMNVDALTQLLSPPGDDRNQEHIEQCEDIVNQQQSDELYCDAIPKDMFKILVCALRLNAARCEEFTKSEECDKLKADVEECLPQ